MVTRAYTPHVYNQTKARNMDPNLTAYVGRGSEWGNPFEIGVWSREEVLSMHRIALDYRLKWEPAYLGHIQKHLRGKHLICWCKPQACHADYLLELANGPEYKPS